MASVFTYQEDVKRIHSPWSTPGSNTPQSRPHEDLSKKPRRTVDGITRLEPEKQDGPCEYKLHLLLRSRRKFVSMTTASDASSYLQIKPSTPAAIGLHAAEVSNLRASYQPSPQTRQARLQQLTTQLLWRLQQSSPFHSSSNSQLVLPVLPEATPRLGVPDRPAKLLPGLEESQGALYELGVADEGTLVGLVEDELEESLNNLRAMAASLGCVCEVLLKSVIGHCEWESNQTLDTGDEKILLRGELFVAEVLVRPDSNTAAAHQDPFPTTPANADEDPMTHSNQDIDQLRVAFVGASTAGKSSLVGTLTTSILDNGRGKSRLSLLKHRHEITSGITSSVAHELIGYTIGTAPSNYVVNYASGDISSWTDIHGLAERQCFLIDSPGLPRYAKSIFRSLVSWEPHWAVFCIAADEDEDPSSHLPQSSVAKSQDFTNIESSAVSLAHLTLCLRLDLPIIVTITKMDLATKSGLKTVLGKVLSALKMAGRLPMLLSSPSVPIPSFALDSNQALPDLQQISLMEEEEMHNIIDIVRRGQSTDVVPIIMASALSGAGIGKLHRLLGHVPKRPTASEKFELSLNVQARPTHLFYIDEVFSIPPSKVYSADSAARLEGQGVVLCGRAESGVMSVGDRLLLGPLFPNETVPSFGVPRSKSYSAQDIRRGLTSKPGLIAKSLQDDGPLPENSRVQAQPTFASVRIVSVRSLRLPVLTMRAGETGTIGIELVPDDGVQFSLQRVRKGMVLLPAHVEPSAYRSFSATFPATDFVISSPPLLLGGHAQAFIKSTRAAVKVTAVALTDEESESSPPAELFTFDEDEDERTADNRQEKEIKITFRLMNTVEWMQTGDQVLVVPNASASGPVAGNVAPNASSALKGFVGRINEVHT